MASTCSHLQRTHAPGTAPFRCDARLPGRPEPCNDLSSEDGEMSDRESEKDDGDELPSLEELLSPFKTVPVQTERVEIDLTGDDGGDTEPTCLPTTRTGPSGKPTSSILAPASPDQKGSLWKNLSPGTVQLRERLRRERQRALNPAPASSSPYARHARQDTDEPAATASEHPSEETWGSTAPEPGVEVTSPSQTKTVPAVPGSPTTLAPNINDWKWVIFHRVTDRGDTPRGPIYRCVVESWFAHDSRFVAEHAPKLFKLYDEQVVRDMRRATLRPNKKRKRDE